MSKLTNPPFRQAADPVYLAASAVASLLVVLPMGTAYFIGIVLITMMTGQLVYHQGSLARAALPYVLHLRWGWHRVERAMERGKVPVDQLFDRALEWCCQQLPVEPVRLGEQQRSLHAIDASTIARLRANPKTCARLGKGYDHRAHRAVRATIVAVLTSIAFVGNVRVGFVRRTRFGTTCEEAVASLFTDLPVRAVQRGCGHRNARTVSGRDRPRRRVWPLAPQRQFAPCPRAESSAQEARAPAGPRPDLASRREAPGRAAG